MSIANKKGLLCLQEKLEDSPLGRKDTNCLENGFDEMLQQPSWLLTLGCLGFKQQDAAGFRGRVSQAYATLVGRGFQIIEELPPPPTLTTSLVKVIWEECGSAKYAVEETKIV